MTTLVYQVYPISFIEPEFKGDSRSALQKIIDFLPRVAELGARYLWLSPIYPSPWCDHGYDVADYRAIDSRFGTMGEFKKLIKIAKREHGISILMDLVLNHTSTSHEWFQKHPEYYCWSTENREGWKNLFDDGSSWEYNKEREEFYLHLFHKSQADLNWFPDGPTEKPNQKLVREFQNIVDFWKKLGVAGFRLDAFQCINKDTKKAYFTSTETATDYIDLAAKVLNEVFNETRADLYLLGECIDLSGDMVKYYHEHSPMNAIMDHKAIIMLGVTKELSAKQNGLDSFIKAAKKAYQKCPDGYAHVTESHDAIRFTEAVGIDGKEAINVLFGKLPDGKCFLTPHTIVMYQGQELGLKNPNRKQLSNRKMLALDAQTKMRYERGESIDELRDTSRANSRVKIPMDEYRKQEKHYSSCLHHARNLSFHWFFNGLSI